MLNIMKSICKFEHQFDCVFNHFAFNYPYIALSVMFICIPIFILIAIYVFTSVIVLPILWLSGNL